MNCLYVRKFLLSLIVLLPFAASAAPPNELSEFLNSAQTLKANFEQEIYSTTGELVEQSSGRVAIAKPGRFRWEYDEPEQLIVADGERLWLYDINLDQITVSDQDDNLGGSPAALLGGDENALDSFSIVQQYAAENVSWTQLEPRGERSDFSVVSLGLKDGVLVAMELRDALDQLTRIRFSDVTMNPALDDALFTVAVPDGVDVIDRVTPKTVPAKPADG